MADGLVTYTTWARLEPRLSDPSLAPGLKAAVEDPLWLLGRQWQLGELSGEDTGSPAAIDVFGSRATVHRLLLGAPGGKAGGYDAATTPLETLVAREAAPDSMTLLSFRLDVAARVAQELAARGAPASALTDLRTQYALDPAHVAEALAGVGTAQRARIDLLVDRLFDGVALLVAAAADFATATAQLPSAARDGVRTVFDAVTAEVDLEVIRQAADAAPAAWRSEALQYSFAVGAQAKGGEVVLRADDWEGERLDWWAFDSSRETGLGATVQPAPLVGPNGNPLSVLPARLGFRGAPAVRYWEFEDADVDYVSASAAPHETALMVVLQFAFVYGGDWSSVPIEVPVSSLLTVESVVVRDTFGVRVLVRPAGVNPAKPANELTRLWFSTGDTTGSLLVTPRLVGTLDGEPAEETILFRDEQANLAWAVELVAPDGSGQPAPWSAVAPPSPEPPESTTDLPVMHPPLVYRLSSDVPRHWFPLVPEAAPADNRLARYRIGVLPTGDATPIEFPRALMLRELAVSGLAEQEVPREGRRLLRRPSYARSPDGGTHAWIGRRIGAGRGEGSSGLEYDTIVRT